MDGHLEHADGRAQLRFRRRLAHAPQAVWRALTEADDLAAWFPAHIHGDRRAGARLRFVFHDPEQAAEALGVEEAPVLEGRVITYEPPRCLEYTWDTDTLRFDLEADGAETVLHLTVTFDELGKAARDAAGWHECLELLAHRLAGAAPAFAPGEVWAEVHPTYVERFGPEGATIGPPGRD